MAEFQSLEEARTFFSKDLFASENGITLDALGAEGSVCSLLLTAHHRNAEGGVMGGVMATLIDFAFATASSYHHRPTVAQQISMSFLNAAKGTRLTARSSCVKNGRTSCVYHIDVQDDLGTDVAQALVTGFKITGR